MNNTNTNWHILQVQPSRTLKVHAKLEARGFEVWTPYVRKHQKLTRMDKKKGISRRSYCHPTFGEFGFMFVGLPISGYEQACLLLHTLIEKSRHIHGVILSPVQGEFGPQWYMHPKKAMDGLKSDHGRSYDPLKDNSKGTGKRFVDAVDIPVFTAREIVQFLEGPMVGIDFNVMQALGDKIDLEPVQKGWIGKVKASAFDLKRKRVA